MKKRIIITEPSYSLLRNEASFFTRSNVDLVGVSSKEEILEAHGHEHADLIVADQGAPAMSTETLCVRLRGDERLRKVSIIVVCPEEEHHMNCCAASRANTVVSSSVTREFFEAAHRLLHISPRAALRTPLGVKFQGRRLQESFVCYANDISVTGMLLDSEKVLACGDIIDCGFLLPDGSPIRVEAQVVRVVPRGRDYDSLKYGVMFRNPDEAATAAIEAYVSSTAARNR